MAKEKAKSTINGRAKYFNEIMERSAIGKYIQLNHNLMVSVKKISMVIHIEDELWPALLGNSLFTDKLYQIDLSEPGNLPAATLLEYGDQLNSDDWIPINGMDLYDGKIVPVHIDGYPYDAPITKESIPLKFRKAEFENFSYKIMTSKEGLMLGVQKRFESPQSIPLTGFAVASFFHIV